MIPSTVYAAGPALLSAAAASMCGSKRPFSATLHHHDGAAGAADSTQKRSPLLCGYPSKKCWAWRVEKRNGELHKFCEYHRQKANTNQRRMEQRRKNGRTVQKDDATTASTSAVTDSDTSATVKDEPATTTTTTSAAIKSEPESATTASSISPPLSSSLSKSAPMINTAMANAENAKKLMAMAASASAASTPRGVDDFDSLSPPLFSWAEVDLDIGMDAAVEYMMIDHAIDAEPSDKPVDLYEEDLYFLEHFIAEIATSVM